ncbi:MAG: acetoacetate--CoA ligase [Actinobacteria bacterium]|nr:acetoacetate--CoA ligase [Actinomycetota bacterium]
MIWEPPADARRTSRIGQYLDWVAERRGAPMPTYMDLWRWSVDDLDGFWRSIVDYFDVAEARGAPAVLGSRSMPGAQWFPGVELNFAHYALRHGDDGEVAAMAFSQTRLSATLTRGALREQVARARRGLLDLGVERGDRVAGYLPNAPEALIAFLATASIGAIWSSCPPEFGESSVLDRLGQVDPKVLFVIDGYRYGAKDVDRSETVAAIRAGLPSLEHTVLISYLDPDATLADAITWDALVAQPGSLKCDPVPFDHPLWILFSSGTTGLPKAIVHGHGGIILEGLKGAALHHDLGPGDRFQFFSTTGWMMWNWAVMTLLVGASFVMIDGDPVHPDLLEQWRIASEAQVTHFGSGAAYHTACARSGRHPAQEYDLHHLRSVLSSGSPLPDDGYRWLAAELPPGTFMHAGSGGTDICSGLVSGCLLEPTRIGEMAVPNLGVAVYAFDEQGESVVGELGELVVTEPLPSMPVSFWNDPGRERLRAAYFEQYPGVWRHGDWIRFGSHGGSTITGRSDATLNRGGVRLGTTEFYGVVEALPEVLDSLVVHLEDTHGGMGELLLFVRLAPGAQLGEELRARIAGELRGRLSPRHVPDTIVEVPLIPRTLTGKKQEVPVKRILTGASAASVTSAGAMENPAALDAFVGLAQERAEVAA